MSGDSDDEEEQPLVLEDELGSSTRRRERHRITPRAHGQKSAAGGNASGGPRPVGVVVSIVTLSLFFLGLFIGRRVSPHVASWANGGSGRNDSDDGGDTTTTTADANLIDDKHPSGKSTTSSEIPKARSRIALVTTAYYPPEEFDRQFSYHFVSKACYAQRNGYDHYLDTYNRLPDRLHPKFSKMYDTLDILPKYDWIYFSDDDILMNRFDKKLEDFVTGFGSVDIHLLLPKDKKGNDQLLFSNFAFFIRNSDFSLRFMEQWKQYFKSCLLPRPFTTMDQPKMWLVIAKSVYEYYNQTVPPEIDQICLSHVSTVNGKDLVTLYNDALHEFNFTTAQSVRSDRQIRPPVAFSEIDTEGKDGYQSGLAFQCNHGFKEEDAKFHENALALHFKEWKNMSRWTVRPKFRDDMISCFGKFYVPNMTIVEDHATSTKPIPLEDTRNMKLVSTLDEYMYGHRRSLHRLPPETVCIQTTGDVSRESVDQLRAYKGAVNKLIDVPKDIDKEIDGSSCTNYEGKKWEYTRHVVRGTTRYESKTWKILILRDPIMAFFHRLAQQRFHSKCLSDTVKTMSSSDIVKIAVEFIEKDASELNPFTYSLDTFDRMEEWIPKARLREFVVIVDPTQWDMSRENVKNALGIDLASTSPPSFFSGNDDAVSDGSCVKTLLERIKKASGSSSSKSNSAYGEIVQTLRVHNELDFELLDYARDLVREQNEFYKLVPARDEYLAPSDAALSRADHADDLGGAKTVQSPLSDEDRPVNLVTINEWSGPNNSVCQALTSAFKDNNSDNGGNGRTSEKRMIEHNLRTCEDYEVGNMLARVYMGKLFAAAAGASYTYRCGHKDQESQTHNTLLGSLQVEDVDPEDTRSLVLAAMNKFGNGKNGQAKLPTLAELCNVCDKHVPNACNSPSLDLAVEVMKRDLQAAAEMTEIIPADVAIHYRCGDALWSGGDSMYGIFPHGMYLTRIKDAQKKSGKSSKIQTISILTQPFDPAHLRPYDKPYAHRCRLIVEDFVNFLEAEFPGAEVNIHNDPSETMQMTYARLVMAKQVTICGASTFCVFPTLACKGIAYVYKSPLVPWVDTVAAQRDDVSLYESIRLKKNIALMMTDDDLLSWLRSVKQ